MFGRWSISFVTHSDVTIGRCLRAVEYAASFRWPGRVVVARRAASLHLRHTSAATSSRGRSGMSPSTSCMMSVGSVRSLSWRWAVQEAEETS